jgi:hypothetical protein
VDELLKEKRQKFSIMIACLSSANLFYDLPPKLRFQISGFAEELVAALRLNEFYRDQEFAFVMRNAFQKSMETILQRNQIERSIIIIIIIILFSSFFSFVCFTCFSCFFFSCFVFVLFFNELFLTL